MDTFANLLQFPLAAQALATDGYLSVSSADFAKIPAVGYGVVLRLFCDGEWMTCYASDSSTNRLYVARAQEGSTAQVHAAGRSVLHVASAAALAPPPGTILDEHHNAFNYDVAPYSTWGTMAGALWVPAGVPVAVEFDTTISVYLPSSGITYPASLDYDVKIISALTGSILFNLAVIPTISYRKRIVYPVSADASGVEVHNVRFVVASFPFTAPDLLQFQHTEDMGSGVTVRAGEAGNTRMVLRAA